MSTWRFQGQTKDQSIRPKATARLLGCIPHAGAALIGRGSTRKVGRKDRDMVGAAPPRPSWTAYRRFLGK